MRRNLTRGIGQSLVEFALIIPVFILLVMFIFDVGRGVYFYSAMYNAVREGARNAVIQTTPDPSAVEDIVLQRAYGLALKGTDVGAAWYDDEKYVRVTADYDFQPITPIVSIFFPPSGLPMHVEVSMRWEFGP